MNSNYILRDWLGTPRVTLDGSGTVVQATDIDPYGRVMDLRTGVNRVVKASEMPRAWSLLTMPRTFRRVMPLPANPCVS